MKKETIAQEALRLLKPIPPSKWLTRKFSDEKGKCCALGHYNRLHSKYKNNFKHSNCCDHFGHLELRNASMRFLTETYKVEDKDIVTVNDFGGIRSYAKLGAVKPVYNQKTIKGRVISLLTDMVKAGY